MRFLFACLTSAILGSLLTVWLISSPQDRFANADDRVARLDSPVERIRPATSRIYDSEGLTADESVAVTVYEAVNRGVVNITAKAIKDDRLLMKEHHEDTG